MRLVPAVLVAAAFLAFAVPASAATCIAPSGYPGDDAPSATIAAWMATGAAAAGLPGELPVMGALVESGLKNLKSGDADSVGYFQMRTSIWNKGEYAGYPDDPPLQLKWFTDYATRTTPADPADETGWGEWVANVERPAAQYRGRYQPRLGEARSLIATGCEKYMPGDSPPPGTAPPPIADVTPPVFVLGGVRRQDVASTKTVLIEVTCTSEPCTATATTTLSVPGSGAVAVTSAPRALGEDARGRLRLRIPSSVRKALARTQISLRAKVRVAVTDAAGNRAASSRAVRISARG